MVSDKRCGALVIVCLGALLAIGASGCSNDLYSRCTPDEDLQCDNGAGCISRPNFDCSSRVCGKYEESDPYCTQQCSSDGDCPDGACKYLAYYKQDQPKYCVPSNLVEGG